MDVEIVLTKDVVFRACVKVSMHLYQKAMKRHDLDLQCEASVVAR